MANVDAPFGFRVARHLTGGTPGRLSEYLIPDAFAEDIFFGDLVNRDGSGQVKQAAAAELLVGIFCGVKYVANDGNVWWRNWWESGTNLPTGSVAYAMVADDPNLTFYAQTSGSITATEVGQLADLSVGTGDTVTGVSGMEVGATGGTEDQLKIIRIRTDMVRRTSTGNHGLVAEGTNTIVEVKIARHEYAGAAAAVEV